MNEAPITWLLTSEPAVAAVSSGTPPSPALVPALHGYTRQPHPCLREFALRRRGRHFSCPPAWPCLAGYGGTRLDWGAERCRGAYRDGGRPGRGRGWADADRGYRGWRECGRAELPDVGTGRGQPSARGPGSRRPRRRYPWHRRGG